MEEFISALGSAGFKGDIDNRLETREKFSHDASMFEMVPKLVIAPKDSQDIQLAVKTVNKLRSKMPDLSITARSAGTDMSGGAINESIILDMTRYMNRIIRIDSEEAEVEPGVYFRDFDAACSEHNSLLPSYPASRDLCTVGGMVANNAGGEKSLQYGKTENFVSQLDIVLSDGNEYKIIPLTKKQLQQKIKLKNFEGQFYRQIFNLTEENFQIIKDAKPKVSKDSTGYHLWNIWDKSIDKFDLTQIIVGSQGTLGIVTKISFKLVPRPKNSGTLVVFLRKINKLGDVINQVLKHQPATFEGFDNYTLMLSFKLFFYFRKTLGWWGMIKLAIQLIPDALMLFKGIPKMVLLIEFNGDTPQEVAEKVHKLRQDLAVFSKYALFEEDATEAKAKKFWIMRRESFNLLRKKVHDKHTAPFIDDLVVPPEHLVEFLPKLRQIINNYKLQATVAGHMGDGNFHVIPLMKIEDNNEKAKLAPAMKAVNQLVLSYGGSLSGEHNDGLIRGPWLKEMYAPQIMDLFKETKTIFDPENIFNPHKKTDARWEFSMAHLRQHF